MGWWSRAGRWDPSYVGWGAQPRAETDFKHDAVKRTGIGSFCNPSRRWAGHEYSQAPPIQQQIPARPRLRGSHNYKTNTAYKLHLTQTRKIFPQIWSSIFLVKRFYLPLGWLMQQTRTPRNKIMASHSSLGCDEAYSYLLAEQSVDCTEISNQSKAFGTPPAQ